MFQQTKGEKKKKYRVFNRTNCTCAGNLFSLYVVTICTGKHSWNYVPGKGFAIYKFYKKSYPLFGEINSYQALSNQFTLLVGKILLIAKQMRTTEYGF